MTPRARRVVRCEIHPAIGIARVGDSPRGYFFGPEVPGVAPAARGGFKDGRSRIKRQVARFRIFGYDAAGEVVDEVTAARAEIEWTVHVANKKGAWYLFDRPLDVPGEGAQPRRNPSVTGDRSTLVIDPGPRTVAGPHASARLEGGAFLGRRVSLGSLRTDGDGRLLFFGGRGRSEGVGDPEPPITSLNNAGWFDDVSDGPVSARVRIGGRSVPVEPAWIVVAPPDYAPGLLGPVTMYDVAYDVAVRAGWLKAPERPSFSRHVFPILHAVCDLQWVNAGINVIHGWGSMGHFSSPGLLAELSSDAAASRALRRELFQRFRRPGDRRPDPTLLPPMYGDGIEPRLSAPEPMKWLTLTPTQLECMRKWAEGDFQPDYDPARRRPRRLTEIPLAERPQALTEAALQSCVGGPFHPGCEITWPLRRERLYSGPFRIKRRPPGVPEPDYGDELTPDVALGSGGPLDGSGPGDLTRWMSVPWQIDTASCGAGYDSRLNSYLPTLWPAGVPNHVITERAYRQIMDDQLPLPQRQKYLDMREDWLRDFSAMEGALARGVAFVKAWSQVGIVVRRPSPGHPHLPPELRAEEGNALDSNFDPRWHRRYASPAHPDVPLKERSRG